MVVSNYVKRCLCPSKKQGIARTLIKRLWWSFSVENSERFLAFNYSRTKAPSCLIKCQIRLFVWQKHIQIFYYRDNAPLPAFTCSKLTIETLEQGAMCEICSKLTIKTVERRHISYLILLLLLFLLFLWAGKCWLGF